MPVRGADDPRRHRVVRLPRDLHLVRRHGDGQRRRRALRGRLPASRHLSSLGRSRAAAPPAIGASSTRVASPHFWPVPPPPPFIAIDPAAGPLKLNMNGWTIEAFPFFRLFPRGRQTIRLVTGPKNFYPPVSMTGESLSASSRRCGTSAARPFVEFVPPRAPRDTTCIASCAALVASNNERTSRRDRSPYWRRKVEQRPDAPSCATALHGRLRPDRGPAQPPRMLAKSPKLSSISAESAAPASLYPRRHNQHGGPVLRGELARERGLAGMARPESAVEGRGW